MIPDESLSVDPVPGQWLYPDNLVNQPLEDWELGGVALNDVSQGLQYQAWRLVIEGDELALYPQISGGRIVIYTMNQGMGANIDRVSLSFDQNMEWTALAHNKDTGETHHHWYDSSIPGYTITTYPGITGAKLTLDDKRPEQLRLGNTDVLLVYLKTNQETGQTALWYRQQRDRYSVEYLLRGVPLATALGRVGMTDVGRVQFEIEGT